MGRPLRASYSINKLLNDILINISQVAIFYFKTWLVHVYLNDHDKQQVIITRITHTDEVNVTNMLSSTDKYLAQVNIILKTGKTEISGG